MLEHMDDVSIEEGKAKPVFGRLLTRMIRNIRRNNWSAGDGLKATRTANGGIISLDRSVAIDTDLKTWRGIVTASGSSVEEHTVKEIDDTDTEITDGRESTIAKAFNKRKGVPIDTIVQVHETEYVDSSTDEIVCYFNIPDGLTANPKDLVNTTTTADTDDWDVETQGSTEEGADFDPSRHALSIPAMFMYDRELTVDSSGFVTKIGAERETFISGDASDSPKDNHITLVSATSGSATGKDVKLNQPQGLSSTVTFTLVAADDITIDGGSTASHTMTFDDSGRYRDGTQTVDFTVGLDGGAGEPGGTLPTCTDEQMLIYNAGTATWDCIATVECPTS